MGKTGKDKKGGGGHIAVKQSRRCGFQQRTVVTCRCADGMVGSDGLTKNGGGGGVVYIIRGADSESQKG